MGSEPSPFLDANDCVVNGWYRDANGNAKNVPWNFAHIFVTTYSAHIYIRQDAYITGGSASVPLVSHAVRIRHPNFLKENDFWGPWEYESGTPMYLGTEYRTTERYLGKPVYCKLIDFGAVPAVNTNKTVSFAGLGISRIISWTGNVDVGGNTFALPYHEIGREVNNASIYAFVNYTGITLRTSDSWFAENGGTAQCTIWYTKTVN